METLKKKRKDKEIWLELVQKHEGMFVGYTPASFLERITANRLRKLLQKSLLAYKQDHSENTQVCDFIKHGCSFLERPIIQHSNLIEKCIVDRKSFSGTLKNTNPELHKFYASNRVRRTHVWNAIDSVSLLLSKNLMGLESLITRSNSLSLINTKEQQSVDYFEQLDFSEKIIIVNRVKNYIITGAKLYLRNMDQISSNQSLSFSN